MNTINTRYYFAELLHKEMKKNQKIWLVVGDLGHKLWDPIRRDFPDRFVNTGAAEQAMMGISIGLALSGKIPFVYSITPFLLYRPFETIRNYLHHEQIPVKLISSGRNKDYTEEGFSHWAEEDKKIMKQLPNIESRWPNSPDEVKSLFSEMIKNKKPYYVNFKRK